MAALFNTMLKWRERESIFLAAVVQTIYFTCIFFQLFRSIWNNRKIIAAIEMFVCWIRKSRICSRDPHKKLLLCSPRMCSFVNVSGTDIQKHRITLDRYTSAIIPKYNEKGTSWLHLYLYRPYVHTLEAVCGWKCCHTQNLTCFWIQIGSTFFISIQKKLHALYAPTHNFTEMLRANMVFISISNRFSSKILAYFPFLIHSWFGLMLKVKKEMDIDVDFHLILLWLATILT